jgi:hypothetical protein
MYKKVVGGARLWGTTTPKTTVFGLSSLETTIALESVLLSNHDSGEDTQQLF